MSSSKNKTLMDEHGTAKIVPLSSLVLSEFNSRTEKEQEDSDDFIELVQSIKTNGLLEPLVVRPFKMDKYEIVAGSRRYHALKVLKEQYVIVIVRTDLSEIDARIFSIIENIHRKKLTPDELEEALKGVYESTKDYWIPDPATSGETLVLKEKGVSELAQIYMKRLHNELTKDYPKISRKALFKEFEKNNEKYLDLIPSGQPGRIKWFSPTDEFRELADRIGYAYSTQYNVLRGYGAFKEGKKYLAELSDEVQQVIKERVAAEAEKDPQLSSSEKKQEELQQKIAHRVKIKHGTGKIKNPNKNSRQKQGQTRTKNFAASKIKSAENIAQNVIDEERIAKNVQKEWDENKDKDDFKWETTSQKKKPQKEETEINPTVAREKIIDLCFKLFKLLTGMDVDTFSLDNSKQQATSLKARQVMTEIATFYADSNEIAGLQHIIIPTNQALTLFRDTVYESVESKKKNDEVFKE